MTYDAERTPRIPTESPENAERTQATPDRTAVPRTDTASGAAPSEKTSSGSTPTRSAPSGSTLSGDTPSGNTPTENTPPRSAASGSAESGTTAAGSTAAGTTASGNRPSGTASTATDATPRSTPAANRPLFPEGDQEKLSLRLQHAVTEFVESPLRAVGEAESAFDAAVEGLTSALKEHRRELNTQHQGEESETRTEELRITLQQYRDLTERLLNI